MTGRPIKQISAKACLSFLAGTLFLLVGCVRHSALQSQGADFLQGVWEQTDIPRKGEMLDYTLHRFRFVCDSVYAVLDVHAKVQRVPDSCYQNGRWTEYARGVYVVRGDSLIAEGVYTKPNGKYKASGCHRTGSTYMPRFRVAHHGADSLVLESLFDQRPIVLRRVGEVDCVPKKR